MNPVPTDCVALVDGCVLTLNGVATVPIVSHIADSLPSKLTLDPLRVGQVRVPASPPPRNSSPPGRAWALEAPSHAECTAHAVAGCAAWRRS